MRSNRWPFSCKHGCLGKAVLRPDAIFGHVENKKLVAYTKTVHLFTELANNGSLPPLAEVSAPLLIVCKAL